MESLHIKRSSERKKIEQIIVCLQELYNSSLVVVTTAQLHSSKPELSSAQIQILLATCQRFVMVRILDNFFFSIWNLLHASLISHYQAWSCEK